MRYLSIATNRCFILRQDANRYDRNETDSAARYFTKKPVRHCYYMCGLPPPRRWGYLVRGGGSEEMEGNARALLPKNAQIAGMVAR